jgi:hypothetical protein
MKNLLTVAALAATLATPAYAGSKEMFNCDEEHVEKTLRRVAPYITEVLEITDARSKDPTEVRLCKAEVVNAYGRMLVVVFELRWTSETDGRYWLQIRGGRVQ